MNNLILVKIFDCGNNLSGHSLGLLFVESSGSHKLAVKLSAFCQLKNEKNVILIIKIFVEFDYVGMIELFRDLNFITDLGHHVIVFDLLFGYLLESVLL